MFDFQIPEDTHSQVSLNRLEALAMEAYNSGRISLSDVAAMESHLPGILLNNYPEGGFTTKPSSQNLSFAMESTFDKTSSIKLAIIATLMAFIFKYITSLGSTKFTTGGGGGGSVGSSGSINKNKEDLAEEVTNLDEEIKSTRAAIDALDEQNRTSILNQDENGLGALLASMVEVYNQFETNQSIVFDIKKTSGYANTIKLLSERYNREIFFAGLDDTSGTFEKQVFFYIPPFLSHADPKAELQRVKSILQVFTDFGGEVSNWAVELESKLSYQNSQAKLAIVEALKQLYSYDGSTPFPHRVITTLQTKLNMPLTETQQLSKYKTFAAEINTIISALFNLPDPSDGAATTTYRKRLKELQTSFIEKGKSSEVEGFLNNAIEINEEIVAEFRKLNTEDWEVKLNKLLATSSSRLADYQTNVDNEHYEGGQQGHVDNPTKEQLVEFVRVHSEIEAFVKMWLSVVAALPKFSIGVVKVDQNLVRIIDKLKLMTSHHSKLSKIIDKLAKGN